MALKVPQDIVDIQLSFVNPTQEEFYYCTKRNQLFSGGYGNGKSYGGSMKAITLLSTFPKYKIAISRYRAKDLVASTMATFFKLCPPELYNESYGGRRNDREGYTRLINGSEIEWIHLDDYSEETLRGREYNSHLGDQMEEVSEGVYITIDSRIERWDRAEIPAHLNPEHFPKNQFTGRPMPPCYNMALVNPDSFLHWGYRRFHPDSPEAAKYAKTHAYFSASTHDNPAIAQSLKDEMLSRDPAWVDRFYWGKWGIAGGAIHYINPLSILSRADPGTGHTHIKQDDLAKLLDVIKRDGIRYRAMDHGEKAPTCCLWFAWLSPTALHRNYGIKSKGVHVCYREYYQPDRLISYHRQAIADLSGDETYNGSYADPDIFRKHSQKYGGRWTVADEYMDKKINAPRVNWSPADNNEMATRSAVAEMLTPHNDIVHPITGESPSPQLLFIKLHAEYPHGCSRAIMETQAAKHKRIGSENGTDIYSDERDPNTDDHAYDPVRYYAVMPKSSELPERPKVIPQFSFAAHQQRRRMNTYRRIGTNFYGR